MSYIDDVNRETLNKLELGPELSTYTFPERDFKGYKEYQPPKVLLALPGQKEIWSEGKMVTKGKGQIVHRYYVPRADKNGGHIPEGFKLDVQNDRVVAIPPGYDPTAQDRSPGSLGSWGKKNMQGWVKCGTQQTLQTPMGKAVLKEVKLTPQERGQGKHYAYELTLNKVTVPGPFSDRQLWYYIETAKRAIEELLKG